MSVKIITTIISQNSIYFLKDTFAQNAFGQGKRDKIKPHKDI